MLTEKTGKFSESLLDEQETERSDLGLKEKILRDSE